MTKQMTFHYARPDGDFGPWRLQFTGTAESEDGYSSTSEDDFGAVWRITLPDEATEFAYRLVKASRTSKKSGSTLTTDPSGGSEQRVELSEGETELWYASGFAVGKQAHFLNVSTENERIKRIQADVAAVHDDVGILTGTIGDLPDGAPPMVSILGSIDTDVTNIQTGVGNVQDALNDLRTAVGEVRTDVEGQRPLLEELLELLRNERGQISVITPLPGDPTAVRELAEQARDIFSTLSSELHRIRLDYATVTGVFSEPIRAPAVPPGGPFRQPQLTGAPAIVEELNTLEATADQSRLKYQQQAQTDGAPRISDVDTLRRELVQLANVFDSVVRRIGGLASRDQAADQDLLAVIGDDVDPIIGQLYERSAP
jgi:hypothetical protein